MLWLYLSNEVDQGTEATYLQRRLRRSYISQSSLNIQRRIKSLTLLLLLTSKLKFRTKMENQPTSIKSKKRNIPTRREKNLFSSTEFRETTNHWRYFFWCSFHFISFDALDPSWKKKSKLNGKIWRKKRDSYFQHQLLFFRSTNSKDEWAFYSSEGFSTPEAFFQFLDPVFSKCEAIIWSPKSKFVTTIHFLHLSTMLLLLLVKLDMDLCLLLRQSMTSLNRLIMLELK